MSVPRGSPSSPTQPAVAMTQPLSTCFRAKSRTKAALLAALPLEPEPSCLNTRIALDAIVPLSPIDKNGVDVLPVIPRFLRIQCLQQCFRLVAAFGQPEGLAHVSDEEPKSPSQSIWTPSQLTAIYKDIYEREATICGNSRQKSGYKSQLAGLVKALSNVILPQHHRQAQLAILRADPEVDLALPQRVLLEEPSSFSDIRRYLLTPKKLRLFDYPLRPFPVSIDTVEPSLGLAVDAQARPIESLGCCRCSKAFVPADYYVRFAAFQKDQLAKDGVPLSEADLHEADAFSCRFHDGKFLWPSSAPRARRVQSWTCCGAQTLDAPPCATMPAHVFALRNSSFFATQYRTLSHLEALVASYASLEESLSQDALPTGTIADSCVIKGPVSPTSDLPSECRPNGSTGPVGDSVVSSSTPTEQLGRLAVVSMPSSPTLSVDGPLDPAAVVLQSFEGRNVRLLALDCEMIYTEAGLELARLTVVNWMEFLVLDILVQPSTPIIDYNTKYSGITASMYGPDSTFQSYVRHGYLPKGTVFSFVQAQELLLSLLLDDHAQDIVTILIGHSLENDLRSLKICYPFVIDTASLYPHPKGSLMRYSLKQLASTHLGEFIQQPSSSSSKDQTCSSQGHSSYEDAVTTLRLFKLLLAKDKNLIS